MLNQFDFSRSPYQQPFTINFMLSARKRLQNNTRTIPISEARRDPIGDILWGVSSLRLFYQDLVKEGAFADEEDDGVEPILVCDGIILPTEAVSWQWVERAFEEARIEQRLIVDREELNRAKANNLPISFDFYWHFPSNKIDQSTDFALIQREIMHYCCQELGVRRGKMDAHENDDAPERPYCNLVIYVEG